MTPWSFDENELLVNSYTIQDLEAIEKSEQGESMQSFFKTCCEKLNIIPHPIILSQLQEDNEGGSTDNNERLISLRNWQIDTPSLHVLLHSISVFPTISNITLVFFNASLTESQLHYLFSTTRNLPNIMNLSVEFNNDTTIDTSEVYVEAFKEQKYLQRLSLRSNKISSETAIAISKLLPTFNTLVSLNLFGNPLEDSGAKALASNAWPRMSTLRQLSLSNTKMTMEGIKATLHSLTTFEPTEEDLAAVEAAESEITQLMDSAKKTKQKLDRNGALLSLGLVVTMKEGGDNTTLGVGNRSLEFLSLCSGNTTEEDLKNLSEFLEANRSTLEKHLKVVKLNAKVDEDANLSSFIALE